MSRFFKPNLDRHGRMARGVIGALCLIAGIIIAFMAGILSRADAAITHWAETYNPLFAGAHCNWLALLPFVALAALLYAVGRGAVMKD